MRNKRQGKGADPQPRAALTPSAGAALSIPESQINSLKAFGQIISGVERCTRGKGAEKTLVFCLQSCAWERKQLFCSLLGASVTEGHGTAGDVGKCCVLYTESWDHKGWKSL